jgi:glycosyltransferase involved in cell wall biosynthesis
MTNLPRYVIVTPARNEADHIGLTLASVVEQTLLPVKWVIVSDGSTDGTDEIVKKYAAQYSWIELIRTPERRERHFAGKVMAFNAGWDRIKQLELEHAIICSLDADVSFERDYFEYLLGKFSENPRLGLAGTPFTEGEGTYDFRFSSVEHVSGACQVFRRDCFDAIGGYTPIKGGGIDLVAVVTARMKGWETRTFTDKVCFHHKKMNSAMNKGLKLPFRWGQSDYRLGSHPAWQFFRCIYQMGNRPYIIGGLVCMSGYFYSLITRQPRAVSPEFAEFRGKEQMQRLKRFITRRSSAKAAAASVSHGATPAGVATGGKLDREGTVSK